MYFGCSQLNQQMFTHMCKQTFCVLCLLSNWLFLKHFQRANLTQITLSSQHHCQILPVRLRTVYFCMYPDYCCDFRICIDCIFSNMFLLSYIQALSCLVQIASVRRSLFSNTERAKFLTHLVSGVKHILQNPQVLLIPLNAVSVLSQQINNMLHVYCDYSLFVMQGLSDPSNYHEFCRLLARLKSNYQLGELVMVENYPEAIQLIAKFTVQSLQVCSETFE